MIETKYPTDDVFEDAVQATAYIARVDVRYGELTLPHRVREHLADGDVVVHLVRGGDDESVLTAQLTAGSKLVGIDWPADVTAGTRVTVMCPRGSTSHDIGVLLPELNVDWPDDDLPEREPETEDTEPEATEPVDDVKPTITTDTATFEGVITAALAAVAGVDPTPVDDQPGPAEYATPTTLRVVERDEQPTETIAAVDWPADEVEEGDVFAAEQAEAWDEIDELDPAEQTAIVPAVGTLPRREPPIALAWAVALVAIVVGFPVWILDQVAMRVRWSARWSLERERTVAGLILGVLSLLVLAGVGALWAVTR